MKKINKSAETKKAFQSALMQKAAAKAVSCATTSEKIEVNSTTSSEVEKSPKLNDESFKKALDLLLSDHPADGRNKRADFSAVLSTLLKLNVDTKSAKEISLETEKSLNVLGFTANKAEGKMSISKDEIPELVWYLFDGYQKRHPSFCGIDADILHNCPNELDAIAKKVWHPIIRYIACQTASFMTEEDAKHLLSSKSDEINNVLKNVKCADQTRAVLVSIAPELGKLIQTLKNSTPKAEVISNVNCPFAGLNPNDFPATEEEQQNKLSSINEAEPIKEEKVEKNEKTVAETTSTTTSFDSDITSKQDSSITTLAHTIKILRTYGDLLHSLEAEGFTVEDAQALVEANALGFSFNELLHNEKMVETLSSIVNALK